MSLSLTAVLPLPLAGQDAPVNIYRFILGVDVPEPGAFVALNVAPTRVLKGSAPKPLAVSVLDAGLAGDQAIPAVAVDVAPYFLVRSGLRDLRRLRANSVAGRLTRVLTKTLVCVGVARDPNDPGGRLLGFALRSTVHDPHDPALTSSLPEDIAAALAGHETADAGDDDLAGRGVDLSPIYAKSRRAMRARSGDPQISAGWGLALRAKNGMLARDSLVNPRHTAWLSLQLSTGRRFDVLSTVQVRDAWRSDARWWVGMGALRKTATLDFLAELYYDTARHDLHPGLALDARAAAQLGVVASITARSDPRRLELHTLIRWFFASDR